MKKAERNLFADINITPLTDIFLVLLIIMMVVAPMLEYHGLEVTVSMEAASDSDDDQEESKCVSVTIAADDQYSVEGNIVAAGRLVDVIRTSVATKPEGVVIMVDPESSHGALAHGIDAAEQVSGSEVRVKELVQDAVQETASDTGQPEKKKP